MSKAGATPESGTTAEPQAEEIKDAEVNENPTEGEVPKA